MPPTGGGKSDDMSDKKARVPLPNEIGIVTLNMLIESAPKDDWSAFALRAIVKASVALRMSHGKGKAIEKPCRIVYESGYVFDDRCDACKIYDATIYGADLERSSRVAPGEPDPRD